MKSPESYDYTKYLKELEKVTTRSLTTFYFNDRENKDIQEYEGKQYNPNYEFGGIVTDCSQEKALIEIRNRLQVGDTLEIIVPNKIDPVEFKITKMWDAETDEEIDFVNPGKSGQSVKIEYQLKLKMDT